MRLNHGIYACDAQKGISRRNKLNHLPRRRILFRQVEIGDGSLTLRTDVGDFLSKPVFSLFDFNDQRIERHLRVSLAIRKRSLRPQDCRPELPSRRAAASPLDRPSHLAHCVRSGTPAWQSYKSRERRRSYRTGKAGRPRNRPWQSLRRMEARPIRLRVNQPASIRGKTKTLVKRPFECGDPRQLTGSEVEELNHRLRGRLGSGETNAVSHHRPGAL
jgi:hypothetical protein